MTTDSGSTNDDVEANEVEPEPSETVVTTCSATPIVTTTVTESQENTKKLEVIEEKEPIVVVPPTVPVIVSTKPATSVVEPLPLNVSIRLPDDINERKSLIKRNIENIPEVKDHKYNPEIAKKDSAKPEPIINKAIEKEMKEETKEVSDKFKTELIIPKVVTMDKVIIKEEVENNTEMSSNLNSLNSKDDVYKENIFSPQNVIKEQINFGIKDSPILNHYPSVNHPLNLKDTGQQHERKEQVVNINHTNFVKEVKQEPSFNYNQTKTPLCHSLSNMIKMEPRDEPMELTNQSRNESFVNPQNQQPSPLNIPTVIPSAQIPATSGNNCKPIEFEEEKRIEKLERPERLDRPERTDLGPITSTSIGQPPIANLMQSSNLVTIGGINLLHQLGIMVLWHITVRNHQELLRKVIKIKANRKI